MSKRCTHVESNGFHRCGSYAFNLEKDGIEQGDLCDVHYWQDQALIARAKLAEQPAPAAQQPVAWRVKVETKLRDGSVDVGYQTRNEKLSKHDEPLYTTPQAQPAREPLTLREIGIVCGKFTDEVVKVVRQTEAAHNIKENT